MFNKNVLNKWKNGSSCGIPTVQLFVLYSYNIGALVSYMETLAVYQCLKVFTGPLERGKNKNECVELFKELNL